MLYFVPMNFVLKQPSNIAQMRAQNEGAYDGYILCYMQKKEKKVLRYAPYHAHLGCKTKNLVCSGNGKGNDPDKPLRKSKKPAISLITDFFDGGSGGIRTHVPLRTTAFRVRLVMTTSILLHDHSNISQDPQVRKMCFCFSD